MTENEVIRELEDTKRELLMWGHADNYRLKAFNATIQALEEIQQYRAIGTVEELRAIKSDGFTDHLLNMGYTKGYRKAIDEFAEALKERLKGMQMVELQGEDVCPCSETGEECPYINQDIGCQYCAREQTIKDIDEIAEQIKGGAE